MIDLTRKAIANSQAPIAKIATRVIMRIGGGEKPARGLGDMIERLVHPIAVALKLPCLDEKQELKPQSPCAKRRAWLNEQGKKVGIGKPKI